ncbi:MAG: hypothetical protein LBC80_03325 [Treponema sp.]|jgi:hypothetical protein|nr:hypothetical protein [Treponema sp.]
MKSEIFRPASFWKSSVMTMPDKSFFELMRSIFGKIKTPFNKQQLVDNLEKFLLREDIQKTITAYIDKDDAKIIAAIPLFDEPSPEQLGSFFSDEYGYAWLHDIIVNLEERFILYRPGNNRLALNPILKQVLLPFTMDTPALFPAFDADVLQQVNVNDAIIDNVIIDNAIIDNVIISDLLIAGLLSFTSQWNPFYKSENVIRKKVIEAGKNCFPGIDLVNFISSILVLGLFYIDEGKLVHDKKRMYDFSKLSARERCEYYAAALFVSINENISGISHFEIISVLYQKRIHDTVSIIHGFLNSLNCNSLYTERTLKKIMEVCKSHSKKTINSEILLTTLEKTGLIVNAGTGYKASGAIVNCKKTPSGTVTNYDKPVIAIDSAHSILVYPEIDFSDAIQLASILSISETGSRVMTPVVHFELNKDSAVRAFNNNITADEIIELLNRLSGEKTNQISANDTLIWNLKDWEKRHKNVSLWNGVIMKLSQENQYLTETAQFKALINETLAPGLYLLNENSIEDAAAVLRNAGIDIIAQPNGKKSNVSASGYFPAALASPAPLNLTTEGSTSFKNSNTDTDRSDIITEFHKLLEKIPLSDPERAELSARIDRRLILCENQLRESDIRYEKLEARHMDYAGKLNIAKQAISQQSPVEVVWPGLNAASGRKAGLTNGEKIYGTPKALEKDGNELILLLVSTEKESVKRIPLAKISLLRRIKKSIFEN